MDIEYENASYQTPIKTSLNVEVCLKGNANVCPSDIKKAVKDFLLNTNVMIPDPGKMSLDLMEDEVLKKSTEYIRISSDNDLSWPLYLYLERLQLSIYVYRLEDEPPTEELDDNGDFTICHITSLPNRYFDNVWESLVYDGSIKEMLLNYITTALLFTDRDIDPTIITWNRVVLLYGPPGTGKTSLCKSLAQKLSIQLSERYESFYFIEINSHSLFSKWFSESGKLVVKMFDRIREYIQIPNAFVCILIDEVESLTRARKQMSGEPSDAIRAVNAVLTEIDRIKLEPNVLIMTTSNLSDTIDEAFMDRADIKQYIGNPGEFSRRTILEGCMLELEKKGLVSPTEVPISKFSEVITRSDALSGRTLRKLPFLAYAKYIRKDVLCTKKDFVDALIRVLDDRTKT